LRHCSLPSFKSPAPLFYITLFTRQILPSSKYKIDSVTSAFAEVRDREVMRMRKPTSLHARARDIRESRLMDGQHLMRDVSVWVGGRERMKFDSKIVNSE
jgi:hypothetical protein